MAKSGFVYAITNDAMPGLVKIGATARDPADRLNEARHDTWAPSCFRITEQAAVDDAFGTERVIHALLAPRRFEARREFFRLSHEEALAVFAVVEIIAGAPARLRRPQSPMTHPATRRSLGSLVARVVPKPNSARGSNRNTYACRCARRTRAQSSRLSTRRTSL